ncbi:MAG: Gfo/Idh/MocA family oxidoreductase, partial [Sedimentisphaerales bacterium]|nr:Gfo/Idh/MocA family oxidoreductase [Sedimentisphaerales bacterium]
FTDVQEKVDSYRDVRKLLEDKNIDAISIATPNHWHALISIWACQAGKDVFVEKPVSHNVWEGRKIVEAARKYDRMVQTGTHKRSDIGLLEAFPYLQEGNLGKIKVAYGLCYKRRKSIGKIPGPQPIPKSVDYNLWTGPAPLGPLMRQQLHYDWHWVWPTGGGDIGNQGIHEMDLCRWAIGQNTLPARVMSIGGRFGYDDDGETPNTQIAVLDYQPAPIIFEVRGLPRKKDDAAMDNYYQQRIAIVVKCENGYFAGGEGGGWVFDNDGNKIKRFLGDGGGTHLANFIKAVRSHNIKDLNADILEGHLSSSLCHLANISFRLGQLSKPKEIQEAIKDHPYAQESYKRFQDHLFANWIDIEKDGAILGPWLDFDPQAERFTGNGDEYGLSRWANDLLTRNYREPFVVPDKV